MRSFGFASEDAVVSVGTNGKMSELSAAMGLTSLENFDNAVRCNRRNYLAYRRGLANVPGIRMLEYDLAEENNFHNVVVEVDENLAGLDRDLLRAVLVAENVLARRYFFPGCHRLEPYRSMPQCLPQPLPATDRVARRVLSLPTGDQVSELGIEAICQLVRQAVAHGERLNEETKPIAVGASI